jgi:hypothetical protein
MQEIVCVIAPAVSAVGAVATKLQTARPRAIFASPLLDKNKNRWLFLCQNCLA